MSSDALASLSHEGRRFAPPTELAEQANLGEEAYAQASADRESFWAKQAERLVWNQRWHRVLNWDNPPFAQWFVGGKLNASYNCVDRHVEAGQGEKVALHWVGEPEGDTRDITYAQLHADVCRAANALLDLGVTRGDRVVIYMPMIPEAVVAMLACARIGALHTVVFGGFSSEALAARIVDCRADFVITADGGYRRGTASALKPAVDGARRKAAEEGHRVKKVLVVRRTGQEVAWDDSVDTWWHEAVNHVSSVHEPEAFDSEHPLYVMYTSGTTGNPKGILHTTGGYLTAAAYTHWAIFDLKVDTDVYWCTADIGWVTGHTYLVYGPLANGATQVLFEGTPDSPEPGRWWKIIEDYKVSIFYTAPTAIRSFMKQGEAIPAKYDLSTLRVLGSVGEPINPEAYIWYRRIIGGDRAPVVDTWWQTETGSVMISPLPGVTAGKPGSAMIPIPGIEADVVSEAGESVPNGSGGYLVLTEPWPSMLRTIWGDNERFIETYWSRFRGGGVDPDRWWYFAGDGAKKDDDGHLWVLGRVDDVMNVSGHRLSTTEIESALVSHPKVAEAAVVGAKDEDTGQAIYAYVILRNEAGDGGPDILEELTDHVRGEIGPIAKPRQIMIVPELPKTRSGKIMRRLLRDVAEGSAVGDTTTLADSSIMDLISAAQTASVAE
ncbi:acetate--CoA ligase [Nocardioides taihuensis]|uniref:Acetyl-coenzyme A synthetase n=1 Tax=Nocardioides taihuensis TaxID=1835606 RepID=A0ABW0BF69_9ACTN